MYIVSHLFRDRAKKKLIIPGKSASKKKSKMKVLTTLEAEPKEEKSSSTRQSDLPEQQDGPDDTEVEKTVRKSTRTAVMVRQAERDAIKAALQATMRVNFLFYYFLSTVFFFIGW